MKLNDKLYDILKWVSVAALPLVGALYAGLADTWGWPLANEVTATLDYLGVFLAGILGVSSYQYNKSK